MTITAGDGYGGLARQGIPTLVVGMAPRMWATTTEGPWSVGLGVWGGTIDHVSSDTLTITDFDRSTSWAADDGLAGLWVCVSRRATDAHQEKVITASTRNSVSVAGWDWEPKPGDDYVVYGAGRTGALWSTQSLTGLWSGASEANEEDGSYLRPQVVISQSLLTLGCGLQGQWVHVIKANGQVGSGRIISNSGLAMTAAGLENITVEAGDVYVVGGRRWRWRTAITPQEGSLVRCISCRVDLTVDGLDEETYVVARVAAAGESIEEPSTWHHKRLDRSGSAALLAARKVDLPRVWGRLVFFELEGVTLDQRIRLRDVRVVTEER